MVLSKSKKLPLNEKMRVKRLGKQLLIPLLAVEIAVMGMGLSSQAQPKKPKREPPPICEAGQKPPGCRPKPLQPAFQAPPFCEAGQKPPGCRPKPPKPSR